MKSSRSALTPRHENGCGARDTDSQDIAQSATFSEQVMKARCEPSWRPGRADTVAQQSQTRKPVDGSGSRAWLCRATVAAIGGCQLGFSNGLSQSSMNSMV